MTSLGAPKDPALRRRRNVPLRGEWVDLEPLAKPVLPRLPARAPDGKPWTAGARRLWEAWRRDPVTALWTSADVAAAWDAIELRQVMRPATANEVRLRMDGLGLTPKGKRDLRYRPPGDPGAARAAVGGGQRKAAAAAGDAERRSRLSVVE